MIRGPSRTPFRLLFRNFFARLFESDLLPEGMDLQEAMAWLVPLFAAPATFVSILLLPKYAVLSRVPEGMFVFASWPDKQFFVGYSMAATGLLTVFVWERIFPDERDALVLAPLPVSSTSVLSAKLAALIAFVMGFALVTNVPAGFFYAFAVAGPQTDITLFPITFAAHLAATVSAALFVFLALVAAQTLGMWLLPATAMRFVSVGVQLLFVVVVVEWCFFAPRLLEDLAKSSPNAADLAGQSLLPPLWFLGVYETVAEGDPQSRAPALRAMAALGGSFLVATIAYLAGYRRVLRSLIEGPPPTRTRGGLSKAFRRLTRGIVRDPVERAVVGFVMRSLLRSRRHRLLIAVYVGVATAFVVASFFGPLFEEESLSLASPSVSLLSPPLVLSFFALFGLKTIYAIPTDLEANWAFRITETAHTHRYRSAVRTTMIGFGLAPLAASTAAGYVALWGAGPAMMHTATWMLFALWLVELLLLDFGKVPFTCSYVPGKANVRLFWPAYLMALSIYGYGAAHLELWLMRDPMRWATLMGILVLGLVGLRIVTRSSAHRAPLIYDETLDDAVQEIGLM